MAQISDTVAARAQAIHWARQLLEEEFLVLDTETTGLADTSEVVEVAVLDKLGEVLFESLVKPVRPCPPEVEVIHGITAGRLEMAPPWSKIHDRVADLLHGKTVVIYNAPFDLRLLQQSSSLYDLKLPAFHTTCAMSMYARFAGNWSDERMCWRFQKLTAAAQAMGCLEASAHRAAADCRMVLGLIRAIAQHQEST